MQQLITDPGNGQALAAGAEYLRQDWTAFDPIIGKDISTLKAHQPSDFP